MKAYGLSHIGMKRAVNQDAFVIKDYAPGALLAVVCDGMGGTMGGKEAAEIASRTFVAEFDKHLSPILSRKRMPKANDVGKALQKGVSAANAAVLTYAEHHPDLRGMGTTLLALFVCGRELYYANVGDSRLYLSTGKSLRRMTKDHSYIQYLIDTQQITEREAAKTKGRNLITRAVGTERSVQADLYRHVLPEGGEATALLCSDGLYNMVPEKNILRILNGSTLIRSESLESRAKRLIETANKNGGTDNITAVLVKLA
ncbi:MAG: Stp1/IreP family PP2C-type Ser/Thr phosphatase [Clostridia bacterium]|nr:Stp1/IreP family PP2C-type Ser/Thr phosphatase [Clostridia bacterium]